MKNTLSLMIMMSSILFSVVSPAKEILPDQVSCKIAVASINKVQAYDYKYLRIAKNSDETVDVAVTNKRGESVSQILGMKLSKATSTGEIYEAKKMQLQVSLNEAFLGAREAYLWGKDSAGKTIYFEARGCAQ